MLRILATLLGPIFAKEMIEISRRRRYYLNRVLYGATLLFTMFVVWQNYRWMLRQSSGAQMQHVLVRMAEALFNGVSGVQFGAVFLFVPLFLCGVIASEREERTLELLFTTNLSDREIVLGKLASRVAALALLVLCGLPVLSLVMLFGGIDPEALWMTQACTLLAVLFVGAHAIYFSVTTKTPIGALVRTYWWLAVWLLAVPMVVIMLVSGLRLRGTLEMYLASFLVYTNPSMLVILIVSGLRLQGTLEMYAATFLFYTNPIGPFWLTLEPRVYNLMKGFLGAWFFPTTFVLPTAWSAFLIWRAVRRLRCEPAPAGAWLQRLASKVFKRRRPQPAGRSRVAESTLLDRPVLNPLWLRARRARIYDREGHIGRIQLLGWVAAAFFLVLLLFVEARELGHSECSMTFLSVAWIGITLLAAVLAGTSLVGDRRRGFLELVLLTPMSGRQVIDGTLLAVWEHLQRAYWLPWALCLFFSLSGASLFFGALASLITATLFTALIVVHGVGCSLTARSVPAALVPTILFPVILTGGLPFLIAIFDDKHGPVLWLVCAVFLAVSAVWVKRAPSPMSVGAFLMAVHMMLAAVLTCWTYDGRRDELPVAAMNPAFLTIVMLDRHTSHWNRIHILGILPCYWTALVFSLWWSRRWLIRRFDLLVGRTEPTRVSKGALETTPAPALQPAVASFIDTSSDG